MGFKKGFDPYRKPWSKEDRKKAADVLRSKVLVRQRTTPTELLGKTSRVKFLLEEQEYKCLWCGLDSWRGKRLVLELDHIDGNKKNNVRSNLRLLCPNCHSQTPTWRGRHNRKALVAK